MQNIETAHHYSILLNKRQSTVPSPNGDLPAKRTNLQIRYICPGVKRVLHFTAASTQIISKFATLDLQKKLKIFIQ